MGMWRVVAQEEDDQQNQRVHDTATGFCPRC